MAKCDGGYFCYSCGEYVDNITQSELYLRYVMGEVPHDRLLELPDGHITCNPNLAQYIVDDRFELDKVVEEPALRKQNRDPDFVREEEERVSRAWRHLQALPGSGIPMSEYPLPSGDDVAQEAGVGEGSSEERLEERPVEAESLDETGSPPDGSMWV